MHTLVNILLRDIMNHALETNNGTIDINGRNIADLRFTINKVDWIIRKPGKRNIYRNG